MSQTSLRLRVVPRYPARVTATNGISATRDGVDLVVSSDYGNLVQVPSVTNPDKTFFLAWDADIDNYQSVSFTNIINNIQDAIIGPPLAAIDAANPGADQVVYFTDFGEASTFTASAFVRGISNAVDADSYVEAIGAIRPASTTFAQAKRYVENVSISEFPDVDPNGNDAFDSGPGINEAISKMAADGGGAIAFFPGFDGRIQTPIELIHGVSLTGPGGVGPDPFSLTGRRGAIIRPAANMAALITQGDITSLIHSAGVKGMTLDGRKANFTVDSLIDLSPVNCRIDDNEIVNGSTTNLRLRNNATAAWINWIVNNSIRAAGGWNCDLAITDSLFSGNYVTGAATGNIKTQSYGNVRFIQNQIEVSPFGIQSTSVDTGIYPIKGNFYIGNSLDLCGVPLKIIKGAYGTDVICADVIEGNRFTNASGAYDIDIDGHLYSGCIGPNTHEASSPTTAHIHFANVGNTGWSIVGGVFNKSAATRFSGLPQDTIVISGGAEQFNRLASLMLGVNDPTLSLTRLAAEGSATFRGRGNAAAVFGVTLADQDTAGAQLIVGSVNGNTPYIGSSKYGAANAVQSPLVMYTDVECLRLLVGGGVSMPIATIRNAANDAAAAALTPAVPVGGVYRNGSILMIRVS